VLAIVDGYSVLEFFRVLGAIVWIGGAIMVTIFAELTKRANEPGAMARFARQVDWLATRVFIPTSLVVFGLGFWLVHKGQWGYGHFWIIWAIVAFIVSFVLGAGYLGPQSGRVGKLIEVEGADSPNVLKQIDMLVNVARIDILILASIVFIMVTRVGQ
jgi:uncharacterized membrane protein